MPDGTKLFSLFFLLNEEEVMFTPATDDAELFREEPVVDTDDWEPADPDDGED